MLIGVLGAGQLGRMLALAGIPLGHRFRFYDPAAQVCSADVGQVITGAYDDLEALSRFCDGLDVLTFEFENVPAATLDMLASKVTIYPARGALETSQDRVVEKTFFTSAGVPSGDWQAVDGLKDLEAAASKFGKCIVKTRRLGYDGKGQFRVNSVEDCAEAWQQLGGVGLIVEKFVPFTRELSLVGVRSVSGDIKFWPLVENVHVNGILHKTTAPAQGIGMAMQRQAEGMLAAIMKGFGYVGVLSLELFDVDGTLYANEMAPRVHNSGHWTIEGAVTSQFENHIRAITGLPLGSTETWLPSVMLNCIGAMPPAADILGVPSAHLHDYGKSSRAGRKVGHVTVCLDGAGNLPDTATQVEEIVLKSRIVDGHASADKA